MHFKNFYYICPRTLQHIFLGQKINKGFFNQDKREARYGGGLETALSHLRPAYVVMFTPTVGFFFIANLLLNMVKNAAGNLLPMIVTEGLTVNILPNEQYEFLMSTKEVAHGYGTSEYVIRQNKSTNPNEFIEGKHFVKGVSFSHTLANAQPHQIFWTKRGIVRLGFFIKSERARLFRDWAEELIINVTEQPTLFSQPVQKQLPAKRKHNRLTQERMVSILADICLIEDTQLRLSITNKLMGGR